MMMREDATTVWSALRFLAPDADLLTAYVERLAVGEAPSEPFRLTFTAELGKLIAACELAAGLAGLHGLIAEDCNETARGLIERGLLPLPPAAERIAGAERRRRRWFESRRKAVRA